MRRFETEPTARRASRRPDRGGRTLLTLCLRARSNSVCRAHIAREFGFSRASFASRAPEIIHSRPNAFQNAPKRHQNVPERPQNAPERPPEHPRTTPERPRTLENDHRVLHNDARMTASGNIWECLRSSGASRSCVSACDLPSLRPGKSLRARPTSV